MPQFDYQAAIQSGYTPEQVHAFIASQPGVDVVNYAAPASQPAQPEPTGPQLAYLQALQAGYTPEQINAFAQQQGVQLNQTGMKQDAILDTPGPVTENFGQWQPQNEVFSKGVTNGIGVGVKVGTKAAVPPGKWKVVDSYAGDAQPGYIGNGTNQGYGNSVLVENKDTGERLRYSHLMKNFTQKDQELDGNTIIGETGATGNVTGPHLNLEYYGSDGKLGDALQSPYARYIPIQGQ